MTAQDPKDPGAPTLGRRIARTAAIALLVLLVGVGGWVGYLQLSGNVHAVVAGQFYRSAQLDSAELVHVIRKEGIKSILNLRGPSPKASWYRHEISVSKELGVTHYDFGISDRHFVPRPRIDSILAIIRSAPKPMIVHCKAGADRAGLVSALYERVIHGERKKVADRQLSFRYGHFPWLGSKTVAMDRSYWAYVDSVPALRGDSAGR